MNVRCAHCGRIYNMSQCKNVNTQYRDVTIWITPCCNRKVDDEHYNGIFATNCRKHYEVVSDVEMQMLQQYMGHHDNLPLHMRRHA